MAVAAPPVLAPRTRRPHGCCRAAVVPDLDAEQAGGLARVFKALADPTRLRIVDALRKAAPEALCQCELVPLFDISQPALSKHLRILRDAGVIACERRGTWANYFIPADGRMEELIAWLELTGRDPLGAADDSERSTVGAGDRSTAGDTP